MLHMNHTRRSLNAGANPFRTERLERIPFRFESGDWDSNLLRLQQMKYRAAIVGRKGSGKTTLLEQLQERLQQHYVSLPHDKTCHPEVLRDMIAASASGKIVLLDGVERFSFWQRQSLFRDTVGGAGLVLIVHRRCRLKTWIHCRPNQPLMIQLLEDLGFTELSVIEAGQAAFERCRGNVREAFLELYDQCASGQLTVDLPVSD